MLEKPASLVPSGPPVRPTVHSFDSAEECSLDHWLEVHWLVEEAYAFAKAADSESVPLHQWF